MKRLLTRGALLLLLCVLPAASGFADVKAEAVCQQDVLFCTDEGLMTGTGRNTFSPDRPMTRAMLVTVLWRMAGSPEVTKKAAFTDVASGSYYEAAVAWAAKNEIASGTSATTFEPNKAVTREQLAKFLFNYAVYQGMDAPRTSSALRITPASAATPFSPCSGLSARASSTAPTASSCPPAPPPAASSQPS